MDFISNLIFQLSLSLPSAALSIWLYYYIDRKISDRRWRKRMAQKWEDHERRMAAIYADPNHWTNRNRF